MNQDIIYFLTVFFLEPDSDTYKRIRCWGWFKDESMAEEFIRENYTDIYEMGYYNYAMIEPMSEGPCSVMPRKNRWFSVDPLFDNDGVFINEYDIKETDVPERFKNICGFSYA